MMTAEKPAGGRPGKKGGRAGYLRKNSIGKNDQKLVIF
jgi:hypothetical protein